jgi:hypothetical protein
MAFYHYYFEEMKYRYDFVNAGARFLRLPA